MKGFLSLPSKILERIVHNHVSEFLSKHNLLSRVQFGFRSHSSTQEALLSVTNTWQTMLSKHKLMPQSFWISKRCSTQSLTTNWSTPSTQLESKVFSSTGLGITSPGDLNVLFWMVRYQKGLMLAPEFPKVQFLGHSCLTFLWTLSHLCPFLQTAI